MKLISVNVSKPKTVSHQGKTIKTGIFKEPVDGRIMLRRLSVDGDGQGDLRVHGGVYKAVYAYPFEHYDYWKRELGRDDFTYGQFGENLTVEGLLEDEVYIGDVFRVGEATVQVTQPRVPCFKLEMKMGAGAFRERFLASYRSGFYFRVLEEGELGAGDAIELLEVDPHRMSVRTILHLRHFDTENREAAEKAVQVSALAPGWRQAFRKILAE